MKFQYQLHEGNVSFFSWISLELLALSLLIIRFLRFCKRILTYVIRYIPILCLIILFEAIVIPVGIQLKQYNSWIDGIWDLREFFLTSFVISFIGGFFLSEIRRHQGLVGQHHFYSAFKHESEQLFNYLGYLLGLEHNDNKFLSDEQYESFLSCMYSRISDCEKNHSNRNLKSFSNVEYPHFIYSTPQLEPITFIKIVLNRYLRVIEATSQSIQKYSFVGTKQHMIEQLDYIHEEIQKELILIESNHSSYTEKQLLCFTEHLYRTVHPAIADARRPWRWDVSINDHIHKLLKK